MQPDQKYVEKHPENKPDIQKLEKKINAVRGELESLHKSDALAEMLRIIVKNGWTTPAENLFANAMLDRLAADLRTFREAQNDLLVASRRVGER